MDFTDCDFSGLGSLCDADIELLDGSNNLILEDFSSAAFPAPAPSKNFVAPDPSAFLDNDLFDLDQLEQMEPQRKMVSLSPMKDEKKYTQSVIAEVMKQGHDGDNQDINDFLQRKELEAHRIAEENNKLQANLNAAKREALVMATQAEYAEIAKEDVNSALKELNVKAIEQEERLEELLDDSQNVTVEKEIPEDEKAFRKQLAELDAQLKDKHEEVQALERKTFELDNQLHLKYQEKDTEIARLEAELFSESAKTVDLEEKERIGKAQFLKAMEFDEELTEKKKKFNEKKELAQLKDTIITQRWNEIKEQKQKYKNKEVQVYNESVTNRYKQNIASLAKSNEALRQHKSEQSAFTRAIQKREREIKKVYGSPYKRDIHSQILALVKERQVQINDVRALRSIICHVRELLSEGLKPISGLQKKEAAHEKLKNSAKTLKDFFVECEVVNWKKSVAGKTVEEAMDHTCNTLAIQKCVDEERRVRGAKPVGPRCVVSGGKNKTTKFA